MGIWWACLQCITVNRRHVELTIHKLFKSKIHSFQAIKNHLQ
jgi:hypothetical protein